MSDETGAVALAKLAFGAAPKPTEEERAIQRGINKAMAEVLVKDARHNPNALSPIAKVVPQGAVSVKEPWEPPAGRGGWVEPAPLALPAGQDLIERMANAALPHGRKGEGKEK